MGRMSDELDGCVHGIVHRYVQPSRWMESRPGSRQTILIRKHSVELAEEMGDYFAGIC